MSIVVASSDSPTADGALLVKKGEIMTSEVVEDMLTLDESTDHLAGPTEKEMIMSERGYFFGGLPVMIYQSAREYEWV